MSKLFTPLNVGSLELSHRLVSALGMEDAERGGRPTMPSVDEYAARVTNGGMIITGPCRISAQGDGGPGDGGLDGAADVRAWRRITEAVHENGGLIVAQLSQSGLMAPRDLDQGRIDGILDDYRRASLAARDAGFDAVELTATTGSLPGQFLLDRTNLRTDDYGGSIDNRITFLAQAVEVLCAVWTSGRVGVRLSPWARSEGSIAAELFVRAVETMGEYEIAYVNLVNEDVSEPIDIEPDSSACHFARRLRSVSPSVLLFSGRYTLATAPACVDRRVADALGLYESSIDRGFVDRTLRTARQEG